MPDKKLTDKEIIKRLERCVKRGNCNYDTDIVLDLINRQKAEIEKLNIQLQGLWNMASLYKAESERWEGYNENLLTANTVLSNEILEAKAKAYKEFAERLCDGKVSNDKTVIEAKVLLKEMVGEEE